VHGDLFTEEKRSPSPAIIVKGKRKTNVALRSWERKETHRLNEQNNPQRAALVGGAPVLIYMVCKPLLMMEKRKKEKRN
jgi:hypothetical protein